MRRRSVLLLLLGLAALALAGGGAALVASWHPVKAGPSTTSPSRHDDVVVGTPDLALPGVGSFTGLKPPDHDGPSTVWLQRHGKLAARPDATCAVCHPAKRCLTCHKTQMPHVAGWGKAHGKAVLASGGTLCLTCHQDGVQRRTTLVALGDSLSCRTCHGLAMPHPTSWVASGHRAAARAGTQVCSRCHTRQNCETCHASNQVSSCRTCHAKKVTAIARAGGHATSQCLTCHERAAGAIGPGPGHRTVPICLRCHSSATLAPPRKPQSARDWTTNNGLGYTAWAKRAVHSSSELVSCNRCHQVHSAEVVSFPIGVNPRAKNCAGTCHSWLKGNVVTRGFLNVSGDPEQTTYRGPIDPATLLANGTTKHTTVVYAETGCAGRCHQGPHGTVTMCITCHNYQWNGPDNLHGTHVSLIQGERAAADPADNDGQAVCMYCHRPGTNGVRDGTILWKRACYSCHLTAHNPVVPYWKVPGA